MTIDASCPNCGTIFTLRRDLIGKRTKCTHCGTPFVISEMSARQPVKPTTPPPLDQPLFPEIPLHQSFVPGAAPAMEVPSAPRPSGPGSAAGAFFGFEQDQTRPRYPAMRMIARGYEVLAIIFLIIAACAVIAFLITVIRDPRAILAAMLSSGVAVLWALATALMSLFISQAIRLGLQIEQNTRETQQSCRQLADHLCAIQVDK